MAAKRTVAISALIDELDYALRNTNQAQYDDETELFEYYCEAEEFLYGLLVTDQSPLVSMTKGTVLLATDDYDYSLTTSGATAAWAVATGYEVGDRVVNDSVGYICILDHTSDNPAGTDEPGTGATYTTYWTATDYSDIWVPYKVWIAGQDPIDLADTSVHNDHLDSDGDVISGTPSEYYIEGANPDLIVLDAPDSSYNGETLHIWYYPNWSKPAGESAIIPFRNMFNLQLREMIKMKARNRNAKPANVEAAWMELYQDRAFMMANQGRKQGIQLQVKRR